MEQSEVSSVMWFNELGIEAMEQGKYLEAAMSFELGVSSPASLIPALPRASTDHDCSPTRARCHQERETGDLGGYFLFRNGLKPDVPDVLHPELNKVNLLTHKAAAMLNLSISLHRAGLETGVHTWIGIAKAKYQSTLRILPAIDQKHAIRIGVYALQNLVVLHYMQFEYTDCTKCLQMLFLMVEFGMEQCTLDEGLLSQVSMAMYFYSQPPPTAGCA